MWQPYLVGAGWDPFMNGAWMWYPGAGYTWVSAYPWGWTPYRYGSWTYLQRLWLVLAAGKHLGGMEHRPSNRECSAAASACPDRPPRRDKLCWSTAARRAGPARRSRTDRKFAAVPRASEWRAAACAIWERSRSRWSEPGMPADPCMPRRRASAVRCTHLRLAARCSVASALRARRAAAATAGPRDERWVGSRRLPVRTALPISSGLGSSQNLAELDKLLQLCLPITVQEVGNA